MLCEKVAEDSCLSSGYLHLLRIPPTFTNVQLRLRRYMTGKSDDKINSKLIHDVSKYNLAVEVRSRITTYFDAVYE